ncbi:MAG: hypothetical protein WB696_20205 [Chthoniobacterales bacterium]
MASLDRAKPFDEEITYEQTKGRPKILDVKWTLFPSTSFAKEIIAGNVEVQSLRKKPPELHQIGRRKGET